MKLSKVSGSNILRYLGIGFAVFLTLTGCQTLFKPPTASDIHLKLGNPSQAKSDPQNPTNFLIEKPEFVLSYNSTTGTANWVSWQLNSSWVGIVKRQNNFRPDETLPPGWYQVQSNDYRGTGYDRGHLVPSGDRTNNLDQNSTTFLMTNIIPQAPELNRGIWSDLEKECREWIKKGKELYIIAGGEGKRKTIAKGKVTVPKWNWKVIVILDKPNQKITENTQIIAVRMLNSNSLIKTNNWRDYRVSVDEIEQNTGLDFLTNIPKNIQDKLEGKVDYR
ncbi:Nuclease [Planktothrix agardhii]|jgi:endonuclease G|uniref:Endonuclease n=1 Tax=Planktothrix agardhii TaxID=1160 RepID=A0A1J1JDQ8_PLAAG|nr:DNA/RNA non-specific endonuclease [Planktothrix agardhii]MCB8779046.1 DNA/RNA non-specific endonuclease [Planktothrix agardhii 1031]MCF3574612.1 DNA/RNA non-specific endonuclease [Planktothrix agardhii 1812]MCF3581510.1 DNA/RNA non-specific endonuclease [Planktothrix agardhii 1811]MCF3597463.1 DNA/RNA non-specific endonuclease [Planktothrix agardhii 1032]MCF3626195.1 DNA/RNA non-specific endonuclease [Planktothrix agardhii 1801]